MWIQLVCLVPLLAALAHADDQAEASIYSDGSNVVCETPGGHGGFLVDGMDVVAAVTELKVCWASCGSVLHDPPNVISPLAWHNCKSCCS